MNIVSLRSAAETFFNEFDDAFASFNGAVVAARYAAPYLAIRSNGSAECFGSVPEISSYFQELLDGYYGQGCRHCRHGEVELVEVGRAALFATATWKLLDGEFQVVRSWRESYNLVLVEGALRCYASLSHAG